MQASQAARLSKEDKSQAARVSAATLAAELAEEGPMEPQLTAEAEQEEPMKEPQVIDVRAEEHAETWAEGLGGSQNGIK